MLQLRLKRKQGDLQRGSKEAKDYMSAIRKLCTYKKKKKKKTTTIEVNTLPSGCMVLTNPVTGSGFMVSNS